MSSPRYTCIESSETISTSPADRAIASASADLPDAVGPTSATCRVTRPRPGSEPCAGARRERPRSGRRAASGRGLGDAYLSNITGTHRDVARIAADGRGEVEQLVVPGTA